MRYNNDGNTEFLKLIALLVFIALAVWWLQGAIGTDRTVLVIFALVGVGLFALGAVFGYMVQRQTMDTVTRFNSNDAQIDRFRMETLREQVRGDVAERKTRAQLSVLEAKEVHRLANQRAKILTAHNVEQLKREEVERQKQDQDQIWDWESEADASQSFKGWS